MSVCLGHNTSINWASCSNMPGLSEVKWHKSKCTYTHTHTKQHAFMFWPKQFTKYIYLLLFCNFKGVEVKHVCNDSSWVEHILPVVLYFLTGSLLTSNAKWNPLFAQPHYKLSVSGSFSGFPHIEQNSMTFPRHKLKFPYDIRAKNFILCMKGTSIPNI